MRYLIDSNIFITAKNAFYQFGFARCFWDLLIELHNRGIVFSINAVKDELLKGNDELKDWINNELPDSFFQDHFLSMNSYAKLMQYSQTLPVKDTAKQEFARMDNADSWLIAHAMQHNFAIITQEKRDINNKKRIMIPNVAYDHNIETITLFEFMEQYAGHNFSVK